MKFTLALASNRISLSLPMYNYRPDRAAVMFQIPPHCDPYLLNTNFIILSTQRPLRVSSRPSKSSSFNDHSTVASDAARRKWIRHVPPL